MKIWPFILTLLTGCVQPVQMPKPGASLLLQRQLQGQSQPEITIETPDGYFAWDAPTEAPSFYEIQTSTNLMNWNSALVTNATQYLVFFADSPQRFARVRAWRGGVASDWALAQRK